MDFRKKFQDILESSYITCQVNETSAWHDIYKLLLPNIPEKLFRYRRMDKSGYSIKSFREGTISLCHAGMFPDKCTVVAFIFNDFNSLCHGEIPPIQVCNGVLFQIFQNVKQFLKIS